MFKQTKSVEKAPVSTLSEAEMTKTKGGFFTITCEEKRSPLTGATYESYSVRLFGFRLF